MFATKLDAALAARAQGFNVFPAVENTKIARIKNWQHLATSDERQIREWWGQWPNDNVAGLTTDKLVLDIDIRNDGHVSFKEFTEMAQLVGDEFTKTAVHKTQGGGRHIIFQLPEHTHIKGGAHKFGRGVDLKSWNGYILLPGSTIDGKQYDRHNDAPIALAPQWLIEKGKSHRQKTDAAGKRIVEEDDQARQLAEQWLKNHAPMAYEGDVDDTTYKVAARLYDYGCSEQTVLELVSDWDETHCFPQNNPDRLPVVVESAGRNREKAIGANHPSAPGFEPVEIDESKAPEMASAIPSLSKPVEGMALQRFAAAADLALASQAEPLVKGILDRGAMSILYGESNTGKTFVAVDIGFHVAAARPWAKRKVRGGAVVYVAAEGGAGVYKRLAALREHYPDAGDVPLFVIKFPVDLLHGKEHAVALVKLCREAAELAGQGLELIVIDTLSRAMSGGDENSSTDMGVMVKGFDVIREATGAHLMVIHHSGKDRAKGARGHSLLRAATDTEIEIERGNLAVTKQRDMDGDFSHAFRLLTVPIGLDADGAVVSSCVVKLLTPSEAEQEPAPVTAAESRVLKAVRACCREDRAAVFGWEEVSDSCRKIDPTRVVGRSTLVGHLSTLSDKGYLIKQQENQYVMK
ncbi:hypothetical protein ABIE87_006488 [Bradyrhizobium diazoefficiens]|uniref:AAA family ATPase n=1 Tax=Bradyrhizobium diazoefficiens TaxID=1355477 RepID=UPI003512714E